MSNASQSRSLRVLLTEGSSTSARQAVTLLGRAGHRVEVCDPGRFGLARFSRHVAAWHRCPGLRDDPLGFLDFVRDLNARERFDVVLPIHEQGLAMATIPSQFPNAALPSFSSYRTTHSKAGFSRLLNGLGLAQPPTRIVSNPFDLRAAIHYPCIVKTSIGTASRGVWRVRGAQDLVSVLAALDGYDGEVLIQDLIEGALEKAQAVFSRGELLGFHAYRQLVEGAGGGDAMKESVARQGVRDDMAALGRALDWHGALSVDYILSGDERPQYIDCNPRLVEPMSAHLAGVDLIGVLLAISLDEKPNALPTSRTGIVSHQAMQMLLGAGLRGGTRRDLIRTCRDTWLGRRAFSNSVEELTPSQDDRRSAIPLAITAAILMVAPQSAATLARRGFGAHLLNERAIALLAASEKV